MSECVWTYEAPESFLKAWKESVKKTEEHQEYLESKMLVPPRT